MLYSILCYNSEAAVYSWSQQEDDAVMARLQVVHEKLEKAGKLGPAVRLLPTTTATTLMKGSQPPAIVDGPYAETKEQLLGFYVVDCESQEEAENIARDLERANPGIGGYEIRPVRMFLPGSGVA
ncbi:MAG: YciI family protein [Gammaproteobacteria bacterium]